MIIDAADAAARYGELRRRLAQQVRLLHERADAEGRPVTLEEYQRGELLLEHAQHADDKQHMLEQRARAAQVAAEFGG